MDYPCEMDDCNNVVFDEAWRLWAHVASHHFRFYPVSCLHCDQKAGHHQEIIKHIRTEHPSKEQAYKTEINDAVFGQITHIVLNSQRSVVHPVAPMSPNNARLKPAESKTATNPSSPAAKMLKPSINHHQSEKPNPVAKRLTPIEPQKSVVKTSPKPVAQNQLTIPAVHQLAKNNQFPKTQHPKVSVLTLLLQQNSEIRRTSSSPEIIEPEPKIEKLQPSSGKIGHESIDNCNNRLLNHLQAPKPESESKTCNSPRETLKTHNQMSEERKLLIESKSDHNLNHAKDQPIIRRAPMFVAQKQLPKRRPSPSEEAVAEQPKLASCQKLEPDVEVIPITVTQSDKSLSDTVSNTEPQKPQSPSKLPNDVSESGIKEKTEQENIEKKIEPQPKPIVGKSMPNVNRNNSNRIAPVNADQSPDNITCQLCKKCVVLKPKSMRNHANFHAQKFPCVKCGFQANIRDEAHYVQHMRQKHAMLVKSPEVPSEDTLWHRSVEVHARCFPGYAILDRHKNE